MLGVEGVGGVGSDRGVLTRRTAGFLATADEGGSGKRGKVMLVTIPNQQTEN